MDRELGQKIFSCSPIKSLYFWGGTLFLLIASFPAVWVTVHHRYRLNASAFQWLLLGVAALWAFWARVWMAHASLRYITRMDVVRDDTKLILEQTAQLAYTGLTLVGFATLLLQALWRVVGKQ